MPGIDRETGKVISDEKHIRQSIAVILTTPVGSRVMRRDFGFACLDDDGAPRPNIDEGNASQTAEAAIEQWEPRVRDVRVQASFADDRLRGLVVEYTIAETGAPDTATVRYQT